MKNAMQFKAQIKKLAQEKNISAQLVLQNYMLERLLERIAYSDYCQHWILKGGLLIASMLGLDTRTTMDLDATIKGLAMTAENLENIITKILAQEVDDSVNFELLHLEDIREKDEYGGYRASLVARYLSLRVLLKIDITVGDAITPRAITHRFKLLFEDRYIPIPAYNIETLLAEKLETIFSRSTLNTRPRDFYDVYILSRLRGDEINKNHFQQALKATATKRHSMDALKHYLAIIKNIEQSPTMQQHWANYQKDFSYATGISFIDTCESIRKLMAQFDEALL